MKKALVINDYSGGIATDAKVGIKHSAANIQSMDFRKSPSQLTVLPGMAKDDSGAIKDLVENMVMDSNSNIYALGNAGYLYIKSSSTHQWSQVGKLSVGSYGLIYSQDQNAIYIASGKTVSQISSVVSLLTDPNVQTDFYNISQSHYNNNVVATFNVNDDQSGSTNTSQLPNTNNSNYIENDNSRRFFQSDIEPVNKISVFIVNPGDAVNLYMVVHDGLNNIIGSTFLSGGDLKANAWNDFVFPAQVRLSVAAFAGNTSTVIGQGAQTYHFHITSVPAGGQVPGPTNTTISSSNGNDISSCDMQLWADRLVENPLIDDSVHPMRTFQEYVCIGNDNYLSVWQPLGDTNPDNTEWKRHRLSFPTGYHVNCLDVFNEYLAISTERVTLSDLNRTGIIFFWDGLSDTYNYFVEIPEGSPNAMRVYRNVLYYYAGGAWYALGSVTTQPVKIRTLPFGENGYSNNNDNTSVFPYASTVRNGVLLAAWPSLTTNINIPFGVYSWGQVDKNFPNSFGYSYTISTGSTHRNNTNNLAIGCVQNFGDNLFMSWRDDDQRQNFGIDKVNSSSNAAPYATYESLIFDNGYVGKQKEGEYIEATWSKPMPSGVSIILKYKIDRESAWHYSPTYTSTNKWGVDGVDGYARYDIFDAARFHEIQFGIDVYCVSTPSTPTITSLSLVFDNLAEEQLS